MIKILFLKLFRKVLIDFMKWVIEDTKDDNNWYEADVIVENYIKSIKD